MATGTDSKPHIGLVLSGYAPAMTLASGALLGFMDKGIEFEVISTSGSGVLPALLALAPKDKSSNQALEDVPNLYISDLVCSLVPMNFRLATRNSAFVNAAYRLSKALPRFDIRPDDPAIRGVSRWP